MQNLIEENAESLDLIIKGIDTLRIDNVYKKGLKQLFIALEKTHVAKETYKYSNFKNQDTIDRASTRTRKTV